MTRLKDKNVLLFLSKNTESKGGDKYTDNYDLLWGKHRVLSVIDWARSRLVCGIVLLPIFCTVHSTQYVLNKC